MANGAKRTVLAILGMRSNACRERVAEVLGRVDGVIDVNVSLIRAQAVVVYSSPCDAAALVDAVTGAGYAVTPDGDAG